MTTPKTAIFKRGIGFELSPIALNDLYKKANDD